VVTAPRVDAGNEPLAVPARRWWTRLSSAHILIFAAGALAFIANLAVLRPSEIPPSVAVAAADLLPGTVFDPAVHVNYVSMATDAEVLSRLVTEEAASSLAGHVVVNRLSGGSVVGVDALVAGASADGRRIMSLPIAPERAAGGALAIGDRVDVIAIEDGSARYVVAGLEVVGVPEPRSGSFSGSGAYHVVVAVDAGAALQLAVAMDTSAIQMVRSTGSPPPQTLESGQPDDR
jgi:Flp pilus assembly protein CpaB